MFKTIALAALMSVSASAFVSIPSVQFPNLDFDMAKNAIAKSDSLKSLTDAEVESVEKIAKRTFLVSLDNGCTAVAVFGKRSVVTVDESTLDCGK